LTPDFKTAARKIAWWGLPLISSSIVGSLLIFFKVTIPTIVAIINQEPVLRIGSIGLIMPFCALLMVLVLVLFLMRIFDIKKGAEKVEMAFVYIGIFTIVLIPIVSITGSLLQRHYLPQLGYTHCSLLYGNPTVYSNDWLKNPELCQYKKDIAWAREQAKAQSAPR
jgi:hypothetical protein